MRGVRVLFLSIIMILAATGLSAAFDATFTPRKTDCQAIWTTTRHDTTYYEVTCPKGTEPPFPVLKP